jgi:hypothetical protein
MIKASIPASWLACFCITEKLVLKSDQDISAYFFRCYLMVTVTGNMIFKLILLESNEVGQHEVMRAEHVSQHRVRKWVGATSKIFPMLGARFRITDVLGFREAESSQVGDVENRSTPHRNYLSCGIIAPRGRALPTKDIHSMLAVPLLPPAPPIYPHSTPNTPIVDISLFALTVLKVFALSEVVKTDRKR